MPDQLPTNLGERGAAAVEFALILPVLLMVVFGIIDFGRGYSAQITVTHAAREGARAQALGEDGAAAAINAAGSLSVTAVTSACTPGADTSVDVAHAFDPVFFTFLDIDLTSTAVMRCGG